MRLQLQIYSFNIEYKPGKSLVVADTLSRAFLPKYMSGRNNNFEVFATEISSLDCANTRMSAGTMNKVKQETKRDETIQELSAVILKGWPTDNFLEIYPLSPISLPVIPLTVRRKSQFDLHRSGICETLSQCMKESFTRATKF